MLEAPHDWGERLNCRAAIAFQLGLAGFATWFLILRDDVRMLMEPRAKAIELILFAILAIFHMRMKPADWHHLMTASLRIGLIGGFAMCSGFLIRGAGSNLWIILLALGAIVTFTVWHARARFNIEHAIVVFSFFPTSFLTGFHSIPTYRRYFETPALEGAWICMAIWVGAASGTYVLLALTHRFGRPVR